MLDPILDKAFQKKGKGYIVALADKECDIEPDKFKLYITTRLPNPHFTPELSAKVTIIDFTVTMKGLEDQLLDRVVSHEKPELQVCLFVPLPRERESRKRERQGEIGRVPAVWGGCYVRVPWQESDST